MIAVGYNGIPEQQHIDVLNGIRLMDKQCRDKIFVLLQMTYGLTEKYKKQVMAAVKKTGCGYLAIDSFLSYDEVAELRIVTDIYINAQTTDAFSGSVCENLYAGTCLLNAKWLRYQEFKDYDFKYFEFENMDAIGQVIEQVLDKGQDFSQNKELVWQLRSWEHCRSKWEKVFREVIK